MKSFTLGFLAAIVLLVACLFGFLKFGGANVGADVAAPAWQNRLFHVAVRASVRRSAAGVHPPLPHTDADLIAGGTLYNNGCAGCHNRVGRPTRKEIGFFLPPDLPHAGTRYSEAEVAWIIKHGIRRTGMSAYSTYYTEKQIGSLAGFVRRMNDLPPSVLAALKPKKPV